MTVNNCAAEYEIAKQIEDFIFVVKTESSVTAES
jgi:hypothetical protein